MHPTFEGLTIRLYARSVNHQQGTLHISQPEMIVKPHTTTPQLQQQDRDMGTKAD